MIAQKSLPTDMLGQGFITNTIDESQEFFRIVEGVAPGIPVSGIQLYPAVETVGLGGTARLFYTLMPADAADKTILWTSSNPSIATVSGGIVTGVAEGSSTITAETADGGFTDSSVVTVGSSTAQLQFDDVNNYWNQSFTNGTFMPIKTTYDAGLGHTVLSSSGGIRYLLRQIDSTGGPWSVVKDFEVLDGGAVGSQSGGSEGNIWLPEDILSSEYLPTNNFYYLLVEFDSSDGSFYTASTQPIGIINPDSVPVFPGIEFTAPDYSDGALDGQQNWNAESGWAVGDSAGEGHVLTPDNSSAAVLSNAIQLNLGETYSLSVNLQFGGTYATPTGWVYTFLGGLKDSATAADVGVGGTAADANIQILAESDVYRLLNNYSQIGNQIQTGTLDDGDELQFDYTLTLGADAASTFYTVQLQNLSDGTDTSVGTVTGVDESIYTALTGSGAFGFFQSINPGANGSGLSGVQVNSVTVTKP